MADPPSVDELCQRARKHLKGGRAQEALAAYEEARQLNDLDPDVHDGLANVYCSMGTYEAAARHFETATRLDPRRGACWINLGAVYNRMKNYQKAAEVLRRAVQIDRKSSVGFYNLGIAYKQLKQSSMAIPAYREAIRLDPKMADAYLNLGNVYLEMGNLAQAATQFRKALEIEPDLERARRGLEKTETRLEVARQSASPFGRLVKIDEVPREAKAPGRELSEAERAADRRVLSELVAQALVDLKELTDCLRDQIDPTVRALNRMLTHQASPHGETMSKTEALERFQEARTAFVPRLRQFRRVLQQVRDHEASVQ
jgi:tetratricopeptide (TPR) repeat protein